MSGYACSVCREEFLTRDECKHHMIQIHCNTCAEPVEILKYKCALCNIYFDTLYEYHDHILEHRKSSPPPDPVNHPTHYTSHPSGIECITITRHMGFNLGNAIKYIWRADLKNGTEDLRKAVWYIEDEIKRRETQKPVDLQSVSDFEHVQGDVPKT